ncbi:MAG: cytochrome c-type biogenesis protein CcmH [Saccharospirillum sp.]|nr:cytochrome c-type biogenesis protein CcmH [Saccharospirillum sp.]
MRWINKFLILVLMVAGSLVWAGQEARYFDNEQLRDRYNKLIWQLRCPRCENQAIGDSNAPISGDMRDRTYEMLHQGYSDREIIDYMVDRYSEFVLYNPRLTFGTLWLWLAPALALVLGAVVAVLLARRKQRSPSSAAFTKDEKQRLESLLGKDS